MRNTNTLQRNAWLVAGLILAAGASGLQGQTTQALALATNDLQFSHQVGTGVPAAQTIRVYSAPISVSYTATAQTANNVPWLLVNGAVQYTGTTGTATQDLAIAVAPAALPAQTAPYTGTVTVISGTVSQTINVSLTVSPLPQIRITPASLPGQSIEANRTVTIPLTLNSTGTQPLSYTATVSTNVPGNWLTVAPLPGTTDTPSQPASLVINTSAITTNPGLVNASVKFTSLTTGGSVTLPLSFTITAPSPIQASPQILTFGYQPGFQPQGSKPVSVSIPGSTAAGVTYTATIISTTPTSVNPWFTLSSMSSGGANSVTGQAPGTFFVVPNVAQIPPGSPPGNYDANIRIDSSTGQSTTILARLILTNVPFQTLSQDAVQLQYSFGGTVPGPAIVAIGATSGSVAFVATPTYLSGAPAFFTVTPASGTTPSSVTIMPEATIIRTLAAGTYTGNVRVTNPTTNLPLDIPVTLVVSGSTVLNVDPIDAIVFEGPTTISPQPRTVNVTSKTGSPQTFTTTVEYGAEGTGWLTVTPSGTVTTPQTLTLNVDTSRLTGTAASFTATLVITPTGVTSPQPIRIPVRFNVTSGTTFSASPTSISAVQNGGTPPAPQTIQVTSATAGLTFVASADQPWITVTPNLPTNIPGTVTVTFNSASLAPRAEPYTGKVTLIVGNAPQIQIPVSLTVNAGGTLVINPTSLAFSHTQGAAAPANQTVNVTSTGAAVAFTAAATTASGVPWLSVTPASGTTNAPGGAAVPLTVSVNPQGLAAGTTQVGQITLTPAAGGGAAVNIPVTLVVTMPAAPTGLSVVHSATGLPRPVAPGEIITIKGRNMAPGVGMTFTVTNGSIPTRLSEVRVLFDGVEAPILYAGPSGDRTGDQINAIVPYAVGGRISTNLVVEYRGVRSESVLLSVLDAVPGIFTINQTGSGQGAILNQDFSVNSAANPAARGSVVMVYATGEGLIAPPLSDGRVVPSTLPLPVPLQRVTATVNGQPADVLYAGEVPGLVAGVLQVNVRIPANLNITAAGSVPIEIQMGNNQASQPNVTVAVKP